MGPSAFTTRVQAMTDLRAQARALRSEGLSHAKIAARLGVSKSTVFRWLDANRAERDRAASRAAKARRSKAELAAYDRAYAEAHRRRCVQCVERRMDRRTRGELCIACIELRTIEKRTAIHRMWNDGRSLREIASEFSISIGRISAEIRAMRLAGWDLPYRYKVGAAT